jgi:hypothetical protein
MLPYSPQSVEQSRIEETVAWAATHGIMMRQRGDSEGAFVHAPFTLYPYEFPADAFSVATALAPLFGTLVRVLEA